MEPNVKEKRKAMAIAGNMASNRWLSIPPSYSKPFLLVLREIKFAIVSCGWYVKGYDKDNLGGGTASETNCHSGRLAIASKSSAIWLDNRPTRGVENEAVMTLSCSCFFI